MLRKPFAWVMGSSLALASLMLGGVVAPAALAQDTPDRLVLGMVPSREADRVVDSLDPLAELLSEKIGIPVETFISTDYTGLVEAVGTQRVDIGLFGPASLVEAVDRHDARIILASVRRGSTTYKSQFNVPCDGEIDDFTDLAGKSIAFVDPASASGYQFPFVFLSTEHDINPDEDMDSIFAGSHDAAVLAVYNGDVDVAVSFNDARTAIQQDFPDVMEKVCILGYTSDIPNDGAVVRSGLSDELAEQIAQAMIEIAETEEGQTLTDTLFNVTGFAAIDPSVYDIVREVSATFRRR
ncbi:MAG: phosphate/phosphite/phosphonate ABC transporter substrate-binding protein [Cyanophyceae cyanobacterium]